MGAEANRGGSHLLRKKSGNAYAYFFLQDCFMLKSTVQS